MSAQWEQLNFDALTSSAADSPVRTSASQGAKLASAAAAASAALRATMGQMQARARAAVREALDVARLAPAQAREVDAIVERIGEWRRASGVAAPVASTPQARLLVQLAERYTCEVERRGGETTIDDRNASTELRVLDRQPGGLVPSVPVSK